MLASIAICLSAGSVSLYAQGPRVTLDMQNATVLEVLESIEQISDYAFFYNNADFDTGRRVSVKADNQPVETVIASILPGFTCRIDNKKIILVKPGRGNDNTVSAPSGGAGKYEITGVIKDSGGEPLVGASALIRYEGKLYGGTADFEGKFSILLPGQPEPNSSIVFSFMGFVDESMAVGNRSFFDITLRDDATVLSESVVVGYGVQKKVNLTGAVSAISEEALKDRPVASVGQALQGMIPNLNITQNSGRPGEGSTYNIRGNTSPNGGSPLILVDGVEPYLDRINSNDIESISVLKDAASAAIYGARGAFGVILVTTKSGKFNTAPR